MAGSATITGRQNYVLGIGHPKTDSQTEGAPAVFSEAGNSLFGVDGIATPIGTQSTVVSVYSKTPARSLGIRCGASPSLLTSQETWLGSSIDHIIGFAESANAANAWSVNLADTVQFIADTASTNKDIKWAVPICTGVEPINETIAGTHDEVIKQIAAAIAGGAKGTTIDVRLGWEPNFAVAYPWGATIVTTAQYKAAFQRVARLFRSVDSRFVICFCVAIRVDSAYPFEDMYPGDDFVDVVGCDAYMLIGDKGAMTDAEHSEFMFNGPCGINRVRNFAQARGKRISINEWGIGYDNPMFLERLADFIRTENVAYHAYWDQDGGSFPCRLSTDQWPATSYAFVRNFGPFHIDTWGISATPGQPLSGAITGSKPFARIEVLSSVNNDVSVVGHNRLVAAPQFSGSRRITVKAYDERNQSATRSIVLTWQNGRMWTPAEFGSALVDWNAADFSYELQRHINGVKSSTSLVGSRTSTAPLAAQRPTYEYRSGLPAFSLDGGDGLVQTDVTGMPAAQAAITYAALFYTSSASANFTAILGDGDNAATSVRSIGYNAGNLRVGGSGGFAAGSIQNATRSIVASFGAGATATCRGSLDGNTATTNTVPIGAATYAKRVMGASPSAGGIGSYIIGSMFEWLSINAVMTTGQEDQTHGYFCWKYGLESQLPGGHPYKSNPPVV